jgi:SAM-dependent methyltransferase
VGFAVTADAYDRFMGRYSMPLAPRFADFAGVTPGYRVLDVGCGSGALTDDLVARLGPAAVVAVDPSPSLVEAVATRHRLVEVRHASAEQLPLDDDSFDAALAQLVVHFMSDAVAGLGEMARVTRPGGIVAACVWDHAGGTGPLGVFWRAARELDPQVEDQAGLAGARRGHLAELFRQAGLVGVEDAELSVVVEHATFEDWWEPYTLGVGPAGAYVASLESTNRMRLAERCRSLFPAPPFEVRAVAWAARGSVPGSA